MFLSIKSFTKGISLSLLFICTAASSFGQQPKDASGPTIDLPTLDVPINTAHLERAWWKTDAVPMTDLGSDKIVIELESFDQGRSPAWSVISLRSGDVVKDLRQNIAGCAWRGGCLTAINGHLYYNDLSTMGDLTRSQKELKKALGIPMGGRFAVNDSFLMDIQQDELVCYLSQDPKNHLKIPTLPESRQPLESYSLSLSGRLLAISTGYGSIKVYSTTGGKPVASLDGHKGAAKFISGTDDDHVVLTLDGDGYLRFWDLEDQKGGDTITRLTGGRQGEAALSFDGKLFAVLDNQVVTLWDLESRKLVQKVYDYHGLDQPSQPKHLVFSKDGTLLVWGYHLLTAFRAAQAGGAETPRTGSFGKIN